MEHIPHPVDPERFPQGVTPEEAEEIKKGREAFFEHHPKEIDLDFIPEEDGTVRQIENE